MKIGVYFFAQSQDGGIYTHHMLILKALNGYDYTTVVFTDRKNILFLKREFSNLSFYLLDKYTFHGFIERVLARLVLKRVISVNIARRINPVHALLKKLKIDLMVFPNSYTAAILCRQRFIFYVDDLQHKTNPQIWAALPWGRRFITRKDFIYTNALTQAAAVMTDSEVGKRDLISYYRINPEIIFPLPFACPYYLTDRLLHAEIPDVKKKYHLPQRYIFYPANFWCHKNHLGLVRAIDALRTKGIVVHAVFCGAKADNYETVITEIEKLNLESQIQYIGFVSRAELVGLYKKAVALVMPAFFGHANIPVMEAFALACPVTVSNVHALPEEVGDAALLFKPDDIHDMAHKIEMLWTDEELRKNFIERGYQKYLRQDQVAFNVRFKEILLHAALVKISTHLA